MHGFASEKQKSKTHRLNSVLLISSTRRTRASNLSPSKLRAALFHRRDPPFPPSPSYRSGGGRLRPPCADGAAGGEWVRGPPPRPPARPPHKARPPHPPPPAPHPGPTR